MAFVKLLRIAEIRFPVADVVYTYRLVLFASVVLLFCTVVLVRFRYAFVPQVISATVGLALPDTRQSVRDSSPIALCTIFRTAPFAIKLDWFAWENTPPDILTANPVPECAKALNKISNICPDAILMIADAPPVMDILHASTTN